MNWRNICIFTTEAKEPQVFLGLRIAKVRDVHFKRQRSRRLRAERKLRWLAALALVFAIACLFDWFMLQRRNAAAAMQSEASASAKPLLASKGMLPLAVHAVRSRKVVYPYSVIPGGFHSIEELKKTIAKDPVVSAQFAVFRLANARIIRLDRARTMHVTYRLGNQVFWTKRELALAKGETLITDGKHTALTRCGNLIADAIEPPVSPNEPTAQQLNTPVPISYAPGEVASDDQFPDIQPVLDIQSPEDFLPPAGTSSNSNSGTGPGAFLPYGPAGPIPYPYGTTPTVTVKVPEPRTAILLLMGMLALFVLQKRKPKDAPKNGM